MQKHGGRIVNILFPLKKLPNTNKNPVALILNKTVTFKRWLRMRRAKRLFSSPLPSRQTNALTCIRAKIEKLINSKNYLSDYG